MSLLHKSLDDISGDDLNRLIIENVREGRTIDYKEALPGSADDDKREFLSDVSSFANAAGGDLVYGMKEKRDTNGLPTGEPEAIKPLRITVEAETLRLHGMVQTSIAPRIPGVRIRSHTFNPDEYVVIIRVPKSWAGLHMVTYKNLSRFYSRNSSGKYQLDVNEIRAGFVTVETGHQRLNNFRLERVAKIIANEGPVLMAAGSKVILHLLPLSSLDPTIEWDVRQVREKNSLRPIYASGWSSRYNFDGLLSLTSSSSKEPCSSYVQLFRNGSIEAVTGRLFRDDVKIIPTQSFEEKIIRSTHEYLNLLKAFGVSEPLALFLSIVGVAEYTLGVPSGYFVPEVVPIREDTLLFPEQLVDSLERSSDAILQSTFDRFWNAADWERSIYYDNKGKWVGHK